MLMRLGGVGFGASLAGSSQAQDLTGFDVGLSLGQPDGALGDWLGGDGCSFDGSAVGWCVGGNFAQGVRVPGVEWAKVGGFDLDLSCTNSLGLRSGNSVDGMGALGGWSAAWWFVDRCGLPLLIRT